MIKEAPLSIIADRRMSPMESIVMYLRRGGMNTAEIAELLNRSESTVRTMQSRGMKKIRKGRNS